MQEGQLSLSSLCTYLPCRPRFTFLVILFEKLVHNVVKHFSCFIIVIIIIIIIIIIILSIN